MGDLNKRIGELMKKNRRETEGFFYTVPSPDSYPYQWLWDSCFHAIILSYFNITDAKKELLSLISHQFENGLIPHMIYWEKGKVINIPWGTKGTSSLTQPPMIAFAAWGIFKKEKDKYFLEEIYPSLEKFYRYLLADRDPRGNHLIGIINPDESGEDNSPRFDESLGLSSKHTQEENFRKRVLLIEQNKSCHFDAPFCMKRYFWVKDVPFNAIMVENLVCLALIANKLGKREDASFFSRQVSLIRDSMKEIMLEDGIYWSTYGRNYEKIKVLTWATFSPLFAKVCTKAEAKELIENHLLNPKEFNLEFLVPTVSMSEASFDPKGFWRGPVWIAVNWFIYRGLINYGYLDLARKIKKSSIDLIEKSGFREQYNPLTGEGMGARDFTWGGLVIDMNEES